MGITPTTQRRAADGTGAVQTVATVAGRTILAAPRPSAMEYGDAIGSPHQKPRFFTLFYAQHSLAKVGFDSFSFRSSVLL